MLSTTDTKTNLESKLGALSLCTWNSRGMSAAIPYLRDLLKRFDIIFITEHWLHANRLSKLDEISNDVNWVGKSSKYSCPETYGSVRGQGGVAVVWRKSLGGLTPLSQIHHDRICGVKIQNKMGATFNLLCVYLPAKGSAEDFSTVLDELGSIIDQLEVGNINIICGDFNADLGSLGGPKSKAKPTKEGKILSAFLKEYNLLATNLSESSLGPINTFESSMGKSCIDYILVPNDFVEKITQCRNIGYEALNTSDHVPITVTLNIDDVAEQVIEAKRNPKLRWDKLNATQMRLRYTIPVSEGLEAIMMRYEHLIPSTDNIEDLVNEIVMVLRRGEKGVPKSSFKKHLKPYWSEELSRLKKEKVACYHAWVDAGRPRDYLNELWRENKLAKKKFAKKIRELSKAYEEMKIRETIRTAEVDNTSFWRILKRETSGAKVKISAIKNAQGKIVHDLEDVLFVWKTHFSELSTPKVCDEYDVNHFETITEEVLRLRTKSDGDIFSNEYFTYDEIKKGIATLNSGKTPGFDYITKEHLFYAGPMLIRVLEILFQWVFMLEYIPTNFRTGIQIPLFKGKNTSPLETKNYRGITLLSSFNKLFEAILWGRIKTWWEDSHAVTLLQGACKKGVSCLHTALTLQETVATQLESNSKVFVSYFDVARAFDSVWIDGLFSRLYTIGIQGRTWRLLYNTYVGFKCRVRILDRLSDEYEMGCGIHQGGYLSLVKYTAFINTLLISLENSSLCSTIFGLKVSPVGYADDVASASTSKVKVDKVLKMVYEHSRKWRYDFNAGKSAILVYGESPPEGKLNSKFREYRLGKDRVQEKVSYDHVGLKNCTSKNNVERTSDKIKKGRRALNAASSIGLKPGGLSMRACSLLFWSLIVPMVTFASELWVLKDSDIELLENFQRYAGRRVQRFPMSSPRETSFTALGWMRLENYIYVKKLLFVRTIVNLKEDDICKKIFVNRANQFARNIEQGLRNQHDSPVFDILKVALVLGLFDKVMRMVNGIHVFDKATWKRTVWNSAWKVEDEDWRIRVSLFSSTSLLAKTMGNVKYLVWWNLADIKPDLMRQCEDLAKIVCNTSKLKSNDPRLKRSSPVERLCQNCDHFVCEDAKHIILQCDFSQYQRQQLFNEIWALEETSGSRIISDSTDIFYTLLGNVGNEFDSRVKIEFLSIVCKHISMIYRRVIHEREGIG